MRCPLLALANSLSDIKKPIVTNINKSDSCSRNCPLFHEQNSKCSIYILAEAILNRRKE